MKYMGLVILFFLSIISILLYTVLEDPSQDSASNDLAIPSALTNGQFENSEVIADESDDEALASIPDGRSTEIGLNPENTELIGVNPRSRSIERELEKIRNDYELILDSLEIEPTTRENILAELLVSTEIHMVAILDYFAGRISEEKYTELVENNTSIAVVTRYLNSDSKQFEEFTKLEVARTENLVNLNKLNRLPQ